MIGLAYALLWAAVLAYVVHALSGKRWAVWGAAGITTIAWGLLADALILRGLQAGHWPLTNRYEFALCFAWMIVSIYLLLEVGSAWQRFAVGHPSPPGDGQRSVARASVLAVALLVAIYAVTRPTVEQAITPLLPALRSVWLQIHVLTALVSYGAFGVAAGLGLARLLRAPSLMTIGDDADGSETERAMERAIVLGFPWLTLSILTGAIWAQNAWGRYWGWDPKETWALITWLWYLLILHVRPLRNWRGRRLALLVVAGLGMVAFTFIGVPWLVRTVRLASLHGF